MNLTIKKIKKDNYKEILALKVYKNQESFIGPVEEYLREANEYSYINREKVMIINLSSMEGKYE